MVTEWQMVPLGDLCSRITYGFTNPMPTVEGGDGPFLVTAKDIKDGRVNYTTARRTTWDAFNEKLTDKSRPNKGDILLTKDGSIGRLAICDRDRICINQSVALLQGNGRATSEYIKYLLESPEYQRKMEGDSDGTTIKHIYITRVDKMEVPFPSLEEQKRITHILGTLDDKIELNKKTNETLEGIAKALFKSWFVDFDPVRAKADGRPTGLPDEVSELFPDRFEESELGEIPSGWSWQSLGDLITLDKGVSYKGAFLSESDGVPMVNLGCFAGAGKFRDEKMKFYMGDYKDRHLASSGDIFVANTDMTQNRIILGSPVVMPRWKGHEKYLFSHHVFALRLSAEAKVWSGFIYQSLLRPEFRQIASGYATGTTVLALPKDGILEFTIPKMPIQLVHSFNSIFQPILERIESAVEINRTLIEVRDALLPRLISGELRVPDAEKILEEAGF